VAAEHQCWQPPVRPNADGDQPRTAARALGAEYVDEMTRRQNRGVGVHELPRALEVGFRPGDETVLGMRRREPRLRCHVTLGDGHQHDVVVGRPKDAGLRRGDETLGCLVDPDEDLAEGRLACRGDVSAGSNFVCLHGTPPKESKMVLRRSLPPSVGRSAGPDYAER
jgi:hypothetical protein